MMNKPISSLLVANRGEIAIRIARAATELGVRVITVFSEDDDQSAHRSAGTEAVPLQRVGPASYLDQDQIIRAAQASGCQAIHPGYGFLSENAAFARRCVEAGIIFVGPSPEQLNLFGEKSAARDFARLHGIPIPDGSKGPVSLDDAIAFMRGLGDDRAVMIKAVSGGGGRGMRLVKCLSELPEAYARCQSEARSAFGNDAVYVEAVVPQARHIEIQVIGDGEVVSHLGERDCSIQRRHQKVIEVAPSPRLAPELRNALCDAAVRLAQAANYRGLGTFEFLVSDAPGALEQGYVFIEANPRLQVEHTVTEEVTGVDLVKAQLGIANGETLAALGLEQARIPAPRGHAIQFRVNMEPGEGEKLKLFDLPSGPGIRVDTFGYTGFVPSRNFDSLLAKVICHTASADFHDTVVRSRRALAEFDLEGVPSNLGTLQAVLDLPQFREWTITTSLLDERPDLLAAPPRAMRERMPAQIQELSPLPPMLAPSHPGVVLAPTRSLLIELSTGAGQFVRSGEQVAVVEAMKMEMSLVAPMSGTVVALHADVGAILTTGQAILEIAAGEEGALNVQDAAYEEVSPERSDLAEVAALHLAVQDEARPEAVAQRRRKKQRTARENIADLCDPGTFTEYAPLAVAAQRLKHPEEELRRISPADGFICGLASVNGDLFGAEGARCMVASYDYTVFAGTQGYIGHKKHDRMFQLAEKARLPVVIFTEGGGGRPPDSDYFGSPNLANPTFWHYARLSGLVPLVGIASGRCFAGNAALLGCCDVVIATRDATIGMGGPVMIEGAGLGSVKPEEVGPAEMHASQGVVDILASDEAEAVALAKRYLSYFQGAVEGWSCADQEKLRDAIPERRMRAYDVRRVIELLADTDSVLELRSHFAKGAVTTLIRVEGRPMGLFGNNPMTMAGAIGADEADKISRFIRLCDAFGIPLLSLCDTPGIMVGPDAERSALVRRAARVFVAGAGISVPLFTVVLRKAYGLGAMAMAGGSFHQSSFFTVAWPTAEFGGMGIEGQVKLGYRKELAAIEDPVRREARFQELIQEVYERGKATRFAPYLSIDDVIDPAETRRWIVRGLLSQPAAEAKRERQRIDTW